MPSLSEIRRVNASLPTGSPLVAVVAGGTTGIGSYIVKALARTFATQGENLRIYIVGRNAARAANVTAEARTLSPGVDVRFVKSPDLALVSEVDRCCEEITRMEGEGPLSGGTGRVDLLYMTYSYPILKERSTTPEGLDAFIATVYYTRMRFITQLLPLLLAAPSPAHIISVYAGTFEDGTGPGEFPIGCPPDKIYSLNTVRKHSIFMKTLLFEEFAERHAGKLSLTDIYPGLVDGPGFASPDMPQWFRIVWRLLKPLLRFGMVPADDCGDVMVYLATGRFPARGAGEGARGSKGEVGGGAYSVGRYADEQKGIMYEKVREEGMGQRVWEHTMEVLEKAKAKVAPSAS